MFTGIIQKLGKIKKREQAIDSSVFYITTKDNFFSRLNKGASIAINGVCLTVETIDSEQIKVTAVKQTLETSALGELASGDMVNLELPTTPNSFLGGHIVMGHADGVAEVSKIHDLEKGQEICFNIEPKFHKYIIDKGSITLDGVSLTVAEKLEAGIKVAIIPETLANTRFGWYKIGTRVNLEVDVIGKYVESLCHPERSEP
jgi:riboflavin synthase